MMGSCPQRKSGGEENLDSPPSGVSAPLKMGQWANCAPSPSLEFLSSCASFGYCVTGITHCSLAKGGMGAIRCPLNPPLHFGCSSL